MLYTGFAADHLDFMQHYNRMTCAEVAVRDENAGEIQVDKKGKMIVKKDLTGQDRNRMNEQTLRTTVIGSYPFPGWLEFASAHLDRFGPNDSKEAQEDAVIAAVHDQVAAGLDVITDGEQTRLDFNLSFYANYGVIVS